MRTKAEEVCIDIFRDYSAEEAMTQPPSIYGAWLVGKELSVASKIKIEDMGCFKEVADVIGESRAKIELWKVVNDLDERGENTWLELYSKLTGSFVWASSPQGCLFWKDINNGINPYNQT